MTKTQSAFVERIERELQEYRLLSPIVAGSVQCRQLSKRIASMVPKAELATTDSMGKLMGRDVILVHSGATGWDQAIETVLQQSPGRLFVVAPKLPRVEALKMLWIADCSIVGDEIFE